MNIISKFWEWLGKEYSARNIIASLPFLFFIGIIFSPDYVIGILFVIYFIAYMATTLSLDQNKA